MLLEPLFDASRRTPDKLAVTDPTRALTYKQLTALAATMRNILRESTDCPRVGLMLPSSAANMGMFFATWWAGKTAVPLNFLAPTPELATIVEDAEIDLLVTIDHFADQVEPLPVRKLYLDKIGLKRRVIGTMIKGLPEQPTWNADDLALILYTSGTIGKPKGVCLSADNLRSNADACIEHIGMTPEFEFLGVIPTFHVFGLTTTLICPAVCGATVHFLPRFQPLTVLETIQKRKINTLLLIASMYRALIRTKGDGDEMKTVTHAVAGGEPLPSDTRESFEKRFGVSLLEGYGLTETSPVVSVNQLDHCKHGTAGRLLPGVEARIADAENQILPAGTEGEIQVRGRCVMQGYYRQPEESAKALTPDGWLHTGDAGTLDDEGFLSITGRIKEMIIVGGENVYPREVEDVLTRHEGVGEAAVIGIPDASRGEVVAAFVVPEEGVEVNEIALREYCRKNLAGYKVPRTVTIEPDLPRSPTGKILKRKLKERVRA